jgi:hypothetical protein
VETISLFQEEEYQIFEVGKDLAKAISGRIEPLQYLSACPLERVPMMGSVGPSS